MNPQTPGIVMRLTGGLGNQLFQYATGRYLALVNHCPLYLDKAIFQTYALHRYSLQPYRLQATVLDDRIGIRYARILPEKSLSTQIRGRLDHLFFFWQFMPMFLEKSMAFDPAVLQVKPPHYLSGYWQSPHYFESVRERLLDELTVQEPATGLNLEIAQRMSSSDAISLHVRRGDYVTDINANRTHGTCSPAYYQKSLEHLLPQCSQPQVFVFSDDIAWAREHIRLPVPTTYLDHNGPDKNYEDLRLMSLCKHNITANSSFSWWGAWLGRHQDKIVCCPSNWFADPTRSSSDLVPDSWVKL